MFEKIPTTTPDAILGLNEAFQADTRPERVNLTVGVYIDEDGTSPILRCVKKAEQRILESESTKSYLNIAGNPDFRRLVAELTLGAGDERLADGRVVTMQTPGGTGALRVTADFIAKHYPESSVWISEPTWGNHPAIFTAAGVITNKYKYYDAESQQMALPAMLDSLSQAPKGDFVLLHGCCHNPTGADPSTESWEQIAKLCKSFGLIPIVDFAYQGFGHGLDEDAAGLRTMLAHVDELMICTSFSKTFGLYRERTGALCTVAKDSKSANLALEALKICARRNYSNPPSHGGAIVATILGDEALRSEWKAELSEMTASIRDKRAGFSSALSAAGWKRDVEPLTDHVGMFSMIGLPVEAIDRLREEFSVYLVRNGRMNFAGIRPSNQDYVIDCLMKVEQ